MHYNERVSGLIRQSEVPPQQMLQGSCKLRAFAHTERQLADSARNGNVEIVYAALDLFNNADYTEYADKLVISPPVFIGGSEGRLEGELKKLKSRGFNALSAHTLDTAELGLRLGFKLHGSFRLNITNTLSALTYAEMGFSDITLSVELSLKRARKITCAIPKGAVVYGKIPLMVTRRCPINDGKTCGSKCGKSLVDRKGNILPVLCDNCAYILNPHVLNLSDKTDDFSFLDFGVLIFTDEEDVNSVISAYMNREVPDKNFTRGLYYK